MFNNGNFFYLCERTSVIVSGTAHHWYLVCSSVKLRKYNTNEENDPHKANVDLEEDQNGVFPMQECELEGNCDLDYSLSTHIK